MINDFFMQIDIRFLFLGILYLFIPHLKAQQLPVSLEQYLQQGNIYWDGKTLSPGPWAPPRLTLDSVLEYRYPWTGNHWELSGRSISHQLPDGIITTSESEHLYLSGWETEERQITYYDSTILQYSQTWQRWDTSANDWQYTKNFSVSLNSAHLPLEAVLAKWDVASGEWIPIIRFMQQYNAQQRLIESYTEQWSPQIQHWEKTFHQSYQYTDTLLNKTLEFEWSAALNSWQTIAQTTHFYNNAKKEIFHIRKKLVNGLLLQHQKISFFYNSSGQVSQVIRQEWQNNIWDNRYKEIISMSGGELIRNRQNWDASTQKWVPSFRDRYVFVQQTPVEAISQFWDVYSQSWKYQLRSVLFYKEISPLQLEQEINLLSCYTANPYQSGETVFCDNLEYGKTYDVMLYNTWGQLVYHRKLYDVAAFQIYEDLSPGLYVMFITDNEHASYRKKLIVTGR